MVRIQVVIWASTIGGVEGTVTRHCAIGKEGTPIITTALLCTSINCGMEGVVARDPSSSAMPIMNKVIVLNLVALMVRIQVVIRAPTIGSI